MDSLKSFLAEWRSRFNTHGVESPALSAELMLAAALGLNRAALLKLLILEPGRRLSQEELANFNALAARRLEGEPTAYILGEKEFYGRPFKVSQAVLIPRPETELIIDSAKEHFAGRSAGNLADLGTGSGCVAVTLALELGSAWRGLALDNSPPALEIARQNAEALGAAAQLDFALADFIQYPFAPAGLDLLLSNPPYVSEAEYAGLDKGVRSFEPKGALVPGGVAGADGLEDLCAIAHLAARALKSGGLIIMEMGCTQGAVMRKTMKEQSAWREIRLIKDLAGLDRLIWAIRN